MIAAGRQKLTHGARMLARIRNAIPEGRALPEDVWQSRHRMIVLFLFVQAVGLAVFAIQQGYGFFHGITEGLPVAAAALFGGSKHFGRTIRSCIATFGLVMSSAILVHLSGGTIEAHFHFFVMLGIISLYQSWRPFLLAIAFVVVHHGLIGVLDPNTVYNHPAAWRNPWKWAAVHGAFVLAASVAQLVTWRFSESADGELKSTFSLLAATLESTADGILVVDNEGKITSFNQQFVEMWRIPDEIIASHDDDQALAHVLSQLEDPEEFLRKVKELYAQPDAESHDMLEFADGRVFERYSKPQRVEGVNVGRVWSFRDVTERKRLDEMKDSFLSAVSHELRTPLTSVLGFAVTLQQHGDALGPAERASVLERLGVNARKLERLLTDILDLDRLGRGILEPRRQPTDIGALIRRLVQEAGVYDQRAIAIHDEGTVVWVDPAKVERIVENLLLNAARHTPDGARIWIDVRTEDGAALITVEDEGPGIPDDLRTAIFEPFRQGPTAPSHAPGVGIGLALVTRFAELHGGRAWVEDRHGGGSSFRVRLPSVPPKDAPLFDETTAAGSPAA